MGPHRKERAHRYRSHTLPSSPTHSSSSSSDFEFTISISPRKSTSNICAPADELFYKGQLLPLHLSPRISMVRTLLLSSSSTSSSSNCTDSRHSSDSNSSFSTDAGCDSSRPSSVADAELLADLLPQSTTTSSFLNSTNNHKKPPSKYFSLSRFSSVFRKEPKSTTTTTTRIADPVDIPTGSSVKRISLTAKEVIRRYFKKAKPLYEKLSQKQGQSKFGSTSTSTATKSDDFPVKSTESTKENAVISHSFSGNLRYPRRKRTIVSSCPSSMRSSPSHSGILSRNAVVKGTSYSSDTSSMEELQSAIQGAIAHCKNSMSTPIKPLINTTEIA